MSIKEKLLKRKKLIYLLLLFLLIIKLVSFNGDRIDDFFCRTKYKMVTKNYQQLSSYQNYEEKYAELKGLYFGSVDCPYCVKYIEKTEAILGGNDGIYYFKVDFNDPTNQKELETFKREFSFETIPHIIIFSEDGNQQFFSKDIAKAFQ